jgi:MarR family transcriptional regulator, organic hydroperoxide resistance regulator
LCTIELWAYGWGVNGELALRRQVCFALYSASRAVTGLYRPVLEPLGLTYPQYLVMLVLWEQGTRTVRQLGEHLMLDSGTLSPLLKRLEAAGLITRERDPADERCVTVSLSARGERLRAKASSVPSTVAGASGMTGEELAALRDTLIAFTGRVTAATNQTEGVHR